MNALDQHVGTYVETLRLAARHDAAWDTASVRAALQWCVYLLALPPPAPPTRALARMQPAHGQCATCWPASGS
jgi:hypothetical protein